MSLSSGRYSPCDYDGTASRPSGCHRRDEAAHVIRVNRGEPDWGTSSANVIRREEGRPVRAPDSYFRTWKKAIAESFESVDCAPAETGGDSNEHTRTAIAELRRLAGLTWEELARLFGVSRRSVHFWASGNPLNSQNEKFLLGVHDVIVHVDRGDARATRRALLEVQDGESALDLLREGRFENARKRLGDGRERVLVRAGALSAEAHAARAPLAPDVLVEAQNDRVHSDTGRGRAARTVRNKGDRSG